MARLRPVFVALLCLVALAPSGGAALAETLLLHCGELLATPGQRPVREATVIVRDGRIVDVRDGYLDPTQAPGGGEVRVIDLRDRFVLPGLIDCHTHLTHELAPDSRLRAVEDSDAMSALRGVAYARRTLLAGFTTVRNVGSRGDAGFALRDAINQGLVPGPRILEAGRAITPTGGHGDHTHGYRHDIFDIPTQMQGVADGVDECRRAVRSQVKRGADVIKLTATGGVLSATAAGTDRQFFEDELEAIVETAHLLGRKVAAHAHGTDGVNAALRAGVDSIEHGTYLDDESIRLFLETGAFLVPTLHAGDTVARLAEQDGYFVPAVRAKAMEVGPRMQGMLARAHAAGVRIAFGTDCGVGTHGDNAREFQLMVDAGMSHVEAIIAATVNAAELLGLSDEIGTIEPGKAADIIATRGSPIDEVAQLMDVAFVMRAGVVHKNE
ncbi:MAG: amidohydrolase family protein [Phycisphaerales bacterium]|nr:MAG: amidohydrolase family protein [Phycisphaerales bacterium]